MPASEPFLGVSALARKALVRLPDFFFGLAMVAVGLIGVLDESVGPCNEISCSTLRGGV